MRAAVMRNGALQGFCAAREMFNNALTGEGRIGKMQGFRSRRFTVWRLAVGPTDERLRKLRGFRTQRAFPHGLVLVPAGRWDWQIVLWAERRPFARRAGR